MTEDNETGPVAEPASETDPQPIPAKRAPEPLAVRALPARIIRFKREVIIGIAAVALVAITGTAWFALRSGSAHLVGKAEDRVARANTPDEAVVNAPKTYADVPQLGRPLPGDLGQPILDHQREAMDAARQPAPDPNVERARLAEQAERDHRAAELKSARASGLLVQTQSPPAQGAAPVQTAISAAGAAKSAHLAIDPVNDPNDQQRKADFVNAGASRRAVNGYALTPPASPYLLSAGSVIVASLITGLRSDLPGLVTAQVTENVYDSATGRIELIPQGARLVGSYDSVVAFGQRRALVVWQRIIMPDGSSITLDKVPATDSAGYSGLADQVDSHSWSLLKGAAISTLLGVGTELQLSGGSDLVRALRQSTQQNASHAGDQFMSRTLAVQPTITVRPGAPVSLIVQRDLILAPWQGGA